MFEALGDDNFMSSIEWLTGYLDGIAKLNSVYGSDMDCNFKITLVERKQTHIESIITANEDWEEKHLSSYSYNIENKDLNYLRGRLNHWFLSHIIHIMFYTEIENPYKIEEQLKKIFAEKLIMLLDSLLKA